MSGRSYRCRLRAGRAFVIGTLVLLLVTSIALGDRPRKLRHRTGVDVAVTAGAIVGWVTSQLLEPELAPATCRWCSTDRFDRWMRGEWKWQGTATANTLSNVLAFGVVPVGLVGLEYYAEYRGQGSTDEKLLDILFIAEAVAIAQDVDQLVKLTAGRERPFVWALPPGERPFTPTPADNNVSFFSGHTTLLFSLVAAAGTVAGERGLSFAPEIWAIGLPLAGFTGYLRVAADKHWATDVITGALAGGAIGWAVPTFLHSPLDRPASGTPPSSGSRTTLLVLPTLGGVSLLGSF